MGGMRLIAIRTLRAYWEDHPDSREQLQAWYLVVKAAKWSNQTRKIVNLLRWNKKPYILKNTMTRSTGWQSGTSKTGAISSANIEYNSIPWESLGGQEDMFLVTSTKVRYDYDDYRAAISNLRSEYWYESDDGLYRTVDLYLYSYGGLSSSSDYGNHTPNLYGATYKIKKATTFSENNNFSNYFLAEQDRPATWAWNPVDGYWAVESFATNESTFVFKFDGPNGFKYKDW